MTARARKRTRDAGRRPRNAADGSDSPASSDADEKRVTMLARGSGMMYALGAPSRPDGRKDAPD